MESQLIVKLIRETFPSARAFVADADYAVPTERWLVGSFYRNLREWFAQEGIEKWTPDNDCDDFAARYRVFASICHARSGRKKEQGIAVGEIFYQIDNGGGGHAINCAVIYENEKPRIICIEPQNGRRVELSPSELSSCWFVRF